MRASRRPRGAAPGPFPSRPGHAAPLCRAYDAPNCAPNCAPEDHRPEEDGHRTQGSGPHHHPDVERRGRGQSGHRAWAGRVSTALTQQADLLERHEWLGGSGKPVAALVKDLRAAQKEWAKAARASDADEFYAHYDKGADLIDPQKSVTAREALGLATTPPSYDESDGGGDGGGDAGGMEV